MAYTPEFNMRTAIAVRRLAWAAGMSMKDTVNGLAEILPIWYEKETVCPKCRDTSKCAECVFNTPGQDIFKRLAS